MGDYDVDGCEPQHAIERLEGLRTLGAHVRCLGWCDSNQLPHWFANVAGPARPKTRDAELQNSWVHLRAGMASSDGMLSQKGSFESLMPAWSFKSFMRAFALRDHTAVTIDVIPSIRLAGLSPFFILMLAVVLGSRSKADVNGGGVPSQCLCGKP